MDEASQLIDDLGQAGDDLRRRHFVVASDRFRTALGIFTLFPGGDTAGIDRLDAIEPWRPRSARRRHPWPARCRLLPTGPARFRCWPSGRSRPYRRSACRAVPRGCAWRTGSVRRPRRRWSSPCRRIGNRSQRSWAWAADPGAGVFGMQKLWAFRWFSGVIARAKLSAPPATCVWMSTPPGKTIIPLRQWSSAIHIRNDLAVLDADVLDDAVDVVRGVVNFAAFYSKHEFLKVQFEATGPSARLLMVGRFSWVPPFWKSGAASVGASSNISCGV